jgi:hypothetical protein
MKAECLLALADSPLMTLKVRDEPFGLSLSKPAYGTQALRQAQGERREEAPFGLGVRKPRGFPVRAEPVEAGVWREGPSIPQGKRDGEPTFLQRRAAH